MVVYMLFLEDFITTKPFMQFFFNTPDSSGKPAGCAAPEDLERIAGIGLNQ